MSMLDSFFAFPSPAGMACVPRSHRPGLVIGIAGALFLTALTPLAAQGLGGGAFAGFKSDGDSPIQIEADRLEVTDKKSEAVFEGNVKVVQGTTVLTTGRLKVYYVQGGGGQQNDIERMEVSGGVHVRSEDNVATADSGTYHVKSEDVVLVGDVTLSQGQNIAKGCLFKANLGTGVAHLESRKCPGQQATGGRIKMLLTPGAKKSE